MHKNLFKILLQKHIKWVKTLLHHYMCALLKWKVILSRKEIKRAKYMLIIWQNLVLNYCGFLCRKFLAGTS